MLGVLLRLLLVEQRHDLAHHHVHRVVAELLGHRNEAYAVLGELADVELQLEMVEPPRFYRRVNHSKDEPYCKAEIHPRLSGRASRTRCSDVSRERADYSSDTAAYKAIAPKLGCSPDSLLVWCQQAERDTGQRAGLTSAEKDRIKELEREVRELRQANEILKKGETIFRHWSEDNGRTHISQRRSSTARSANDRVHR